jgi:hypothetical protein
MIGNWTESSNLTTLILDQLAACLRKRTIFSLQAANRYNHFGKYISIPIFKNSNIKVQIKSNIGLIYFYNIFLFCGAFKSSS